MSRHRKAWLAWGAAFVAIEAHALLTEAPRGTLSENIWAVCGVHEPVPYHHARKVALGSFMAWLAIHLVTGKLSHPVRRRKLIHQPNS